ncbi:MAG: glycosyltransferase family 4 protein [Promethearchaeota archaeon]
MNILRLTTRIFPDKAGPAKYAYLLSSHVAGERFKMFNISSRPKTIKQNYESINSNYKIFYLPITAPRWDEELYKQFVFLIKFVYHSMAKIVKLHSKYRIDLIHCDNPAITGVIAVILNRLFRIPFIYTHHGLDSHFKINFLAELRLIYNFSKYHIIVSRKMKKFFIKNKVNIKKLVWIPTGIELDNFFHVKNKNEKLALINELNISNNVNQDDFIILYVGYMDLKQKVLGMLDFLNGFKIFLDKVHQSKRDNIKLLYLGDGKYRYLLYNEIKKLNMNKNAFTLGTRLNVEKFYAISDLNALTSYMEGFPTVLLEAIASNVPCISTDVGEVREIIDNDFIIQPGKRYDIADLILKSYENYEITQIAVQNSLERIKQFDWDHIAKTIKKIYLKTLFPKLFEPTRKYNILRLTTRIYPDKAGPAKNTYMLSKYVSEDYYRIFNISCLPYGQKGKMKQVNSYFRIDYLPMHAPRWDAEFHYQLLFLIKFVIYSIRKMLKLHRNHRIDLIHCENPAITGLIALLFNRIFKIPFIYHHRGLDSHFKINFLLELRLIYRYSKKHIIVSRQMKKFFIKNKVNTKKLIWVPNGIELSKFFHAKTMITRKQIIDDLNIDSKITSEDFIISYIGYMDLEQKVKGMIDFLNAFKDFLNKRKEFEKKKLKLLYLGDGKYRYRLENEIKRLELDHNVLTLGVRLDVEKFYAVSNLCALTSYIEGFPTVLLEAVAAKVPCISTDTGEVREIIADESIVPVGDRVSITRKIQELFEDENLRQIIVEKSSKKIEKYEWSNVADKIRKLYKNIITMS